ncbi:MAG: phasin family protein [Pseudomonadota bacterium]
MPRAKSKAAPKPAAAPDMSPVLGLTTAMMAANPAITKAWTDIMNESARFVSERLQEDMEAQKALMQCKTPADLVVFQSEFVLKAMQQYANEAQRMTKIMTDAGDELTKDARQTWSRAYDDVPL